MRPLLSRRLSSLLIACCILVAPAIQAQEKIDAYDLLLKLAIDAIDWEFDKSWAYTETSIRDSRTWVARFDPSRDEDEKWTVLLVDGGQPDADDIDEFLDEKDIEEFVSDLAPEVKDMARPGSLKMLEETDEHYVFSFEPNETNSDLVGNVDGRIRIVREGRYLALIENRNNKKIHAGMGTRIDEFLDRFTFARAQEGGPVVPHSIEVHVKGRALMLIKFDETTVRKFSDFEFVGD